MPPGATAIEGKAEVPLLSLIPPPLAEPGPTSSQPALLSAVGRSRGEGASAPHTWKRARSSNWLMFSMDITGTLCSAAVTRVRSGTAGAGKADWLGAVGGIPPVSSSARATARLNSVNTCAFIVLVLLVVWRAMACGNPACRFTGRDLGSAAKLLLAATLARSLHHSTSRQLSSE